MPIQISVVNGAVSGGTLSWGCNFEWVNPTASVANLTCCGSFCTLPSYSVPAATGPGQPGILAAQLLPNFQFNFGDSAWMNPGMPHISNPPAPCIDVDDDDDTHEHHHEHHHHDRDKDVA